MDFPFNFVGYSMALMLVNVQFGQPLMRSAFLVVYCRAVVCSLHERPQAQTRGACSVVAVLLC